MPTEVRLHKEDKLESADCRWCHQGNAGEEHHIWNCPAVIQETRILRAMAALMETQIAEWGGAKSDAARNTRGLYPQSRKEWSIAEFSSEARRDMKGGSIAEPAARSLTGCIATDGGVSGGDKPATALGAWAWHHPASGAEARGYVERRPGHIMSSGRAEVAALAQATPFAGRGAVFLIDNLTVATRLQALVAWAKGHRQEAVELVSQAEKAEQTEESTAQSANLDNAAAVAHMRAVAPAMLTGEQQGDETGQGTMLEQRLILDRDP